MSGPRQSIGHYRPRLPSDWNATQGIKQPQQVEKPEHERDDDDESDH